MAEGKQTVGVGIVGCGKIAPAYFSGARQFEVLELVACADLNMDAARAMAEQNGCRALTVEALLADPAVDLVVNLTIPAAHAELSLAALDAGKHVYSEKPLAARREDAERVLEAARAKDLRVGCAPDTVLGAGIQTCRKIVDDGGIGRPVAGTAFMMGRGPEKWHPNPAFFYKAGAGPMFDMGPYYLTALVTLLGPVRSVCAVTTRAFDERVAGCAERRGEILPVEVPTHYAGTLEFHNGAVISMVISFDVHRHGHGPIEVYGTDGALKVPDPNTFGGPVELYTPEAEAWQPRALTHGYAENTRGIGAADLAHAVLSGRPHRASGALACHVLEVMLAFETASDTGRRVAIASRPERPAPMPPALTRGVDRVGGQAKRERPNVILPYADDFTTRRQHPYREQ
jgi:predicted dehydrogenase